VSAKSVLIGALFFGGIVVAAVTYMTSKNHAQPNDNIAMVDADTPTEKLAEAIQKKPQSADPSAADSRRPIDEVVKQCLPSVAVVKGKVGHGTGFLLPQNILATNAHVVALEFESNIRVSFPSAPKEKQGPYKVKFLWADRKRDLAFLQVDCDLEPLDLAEDYTVKPGEEVIAIGSPGIGNNEMLPNAPSKGLMSGMTKLGGQPFYSLSISVNPGNSGGPLIDMKGKVLGMITAKLRDKDGIAFAIPLADLHQGYEEKALDEGRLFGPELESWLRASTVFERLIYLGSEYSYGLDTYTQAMAAAAIRGGTPNDGLQDAKREVSDRMKLVDKIFADSLEKNLAVVLADSNIDPPDRTRISELWKCCSEMKSLFDHPRGTIDSFRKKKDKLKQDFSRLTGLMERVQKPARK
jgi:V8-like Glu-specific endopeptidase